MIIHPSLLLDLSTTSGLLWNPWMTAKPDFKPDPPYTSVLKSDHISPPGHVLLLTTCESKMANVQVLFCVFMDRDGVEVQKTRKKRTMLISSHLDRTSLVNKGLYGFRGNFYCGTRRVVPSGRDKSILPARIANHSVEFDSSCPL